LFDRFPEALIQHTSRFNLKPKPMKTKLPVAAALALLASCSIPRFADLSKKDNLEGKAKFDFNTSKIRASGRGFSLNMKYANEAPKKVALVSFYVDDPGITKVSGTNASGKTYHTTNTGEDAARAYADEFLSNGIESLKADFKKFNVTLLTPAEFLTDDAKKKAYNDFVVRNTKLNELGAKIGAFFKDGASAGTTIETDASASGYRLLKINKREHIDTKHKNRTQPQNLSGSINSEMIESVGFELCKSLDVDAVLIIYNTQTADNKWSRTRHWMDAVSMYMFGPNPLPLKEGKKDNMFYSKGIFYCGTRIWFKKPLILDPKIKDESLKAQVMKDNYTAYNKVLEGLAGKMEHYYEKELEKKK
jgi:hypothetical protein